MAFYLEEDEVYKCTTHPTKRRLIGICPHCLHQRLSLLCPNCATTRPCACYTTTTTTTTTTTSTSSSSASSSFSFNFSDTKISTLIDDEPPYRRSRSSTFHFLHRSNRFSTVDDDKSHPKMSSFWSVLMWYKKPRGEKGGGDPEMRRSRSVATVCSTESGGSNVKSKGWYFPSPMKFFRRSYSRTPKFVHERSPLHRG